MLKDSLHFAYLTLLLYVFIPICLEHQQAQPAMIRALVPTSTVQSLLPAPARHFGIPHPSHWGTSLHAAERSHGTVALLPSHQKLALNTDPLPISSG